MKTIKIPSKKIVALSDEFESYELERIQNIPFTIFIYSYNYDSYSGSGFAVWKVGSDWFYDDLGHCSCNGPTSMIGTSSKMKVSLKQLLEVSKSYDGDHVKKVIDYIKTHV